MSIIRFDNAIFFKKLSLTFAIVYFSFKAHTNNYTLLLEIKFLIFLMSKKPDFQMNSKFLRKYPCL
ncbi:hypothetical protein BpHYR1_046674 [Brachionus plicatilis]|uniref:Uncharacterized protein n=1 Tax=Brachionus plicatilis TaxID=10195 RepID=A0A3M7RVD6_BRAPC|nr:hypothetical protein BpHYR1_046674 [Brachionus plicatilis]